MRSPRAWTLLLPCCLHTVEIYGLPGSLELLHFTHTLELFMLHLQAVCAPLGLPLPTLAPWLAHGELLIGASR